MVRWLLCAFAVVLAALRTADAKPSFDRIQMLERDEPIEPCTRGKTWPAVQRCLGKSGTVAVIFQNENAKVVTVTPKATPEIKRVLLYAQVDKAWVRGGVNSIATSTNELLRVVAFPTPQGEGVRVDMGSSQRTSFTIDQFSTVRGVLRRTFATVCVPSTWSCRLLTTSCEIYVRGKVYWAFHGEPVWHLSLGIRMRGDTRLAGGACKQARSVLVPEED